MATYLVTRRVNLGWGNAFPGELIEDPERAMILVERGYITPVPSDYPGALVTPPEPSVEAKVESDEPPPSSAEDESSTAEAESSEGPADTGDSESAEDSAEAEEEVTEDSPRPRATVRRRPK